MDLQVSGEDEWMDGWRSGWMSGWMGGKTGFKHQFVRVLVTDFRGSRDPRTLEKNVLENRNSQCEGSVGDSMTPLCPWFFLSGDGDLSPEAM